MPNILKSLINRQFGKLIVISRAENDIRGNTRWNCKCQCGQEIICNRANLQSGASQSCGCLRSELRKNLSPCCGKGHEFTPENTYIDNTNHRQCRACKKEWIDKNKIKIEKKAKIARSKWYKNKKSQDPNYGRKAHLKYAYGITHDDYEKMFKEQEGKCAICNNPSEIGQLLHVDHSHQSNKIRKLLCRWCNQGLGQFKDNSELLIKAAEYLKEFS